MRTNKNAKDHRVDYDHRTAGGLGALAAKQTAEQHLRRLVLTCTLWEDNFYIDGMSIAGKIAELVPQVDPATVSKLAFETRNIQKLRHAPLFMAVEMAKYTEHKRYLGNLLPQIIKRADEINEFMALYWKDGKCPIAKQVKIGLAKCFDNFDAYQFAKYDRKTEIKFKDVMAMVHPKPAQGKELLYQQIMEGTLPTPDTWEVALSSGADKEKSWTRLIQERKLGAVAFLRNLRNMIDTNVPHTVILEGFANVNPKWLVPMNFFAAAQAAPDYTREIEDLMFRCFATMPKLPGRTIFIVDVSGSMRLPISAKSMFNRLDSAYALAMLAAEVCEHVDIYATAGNDYTCEHATAKVPAYRGFGLIKAIKDVNAKVGGGGIFTRQCLEYVRAHDAHKPDRIMIFSDSQDCDRKNRALPRPFGKYNYIIDVSSHEYGIAYDGLWDAEISGWSEHFLTFIAGFEGLMNK